MVLVLKLNFLQSYHENIWCPEMAPNILRWIRLEHTFSIFSGMDSISIVVS